jgi:hypothetical protein
MMTKKLEIELLKRINDLEKQLHKLTLRAENNQLDKHLYSVAETAIMLSRTPQAVYAMISRGELESTRLGHIMILGDSLRKIMKGKIA